MERIPGLAVEGHQRRVRARSSRPFDLLTILLFVFSDALDQLQLKRYCCRRMVLTHVDLIEKLLQYNRTSYLFVPLIALLMSPQPTRGNRTKRGPEPVLYHLYPLSCCRIYLVSFAMSPSSSHAIHLCLDNATNTTWCCASGSMPCPAGID